MYSPTDSQAVRAANDGIRDCETVLLGLRQTHPHRLASVLMTFALGSIFSGAGLNLETSWFAAAWALLNLASFHYLTAPSIASVEALHMMVTFLFATGRPKAAKAAWPILGACIRTACSVGLHRDSGRWAVSGDRKAHRDRLAWECITYDVL